MIPASAVLTIAHLDPYAVAIDDADHALPVEAAMVDHYAQLLIAHPDQDTDPILVVRRGDRLCVRRGRHRVLAHRQVGRQGILAMTYEEQRG